MRNRTARARRALLGVSTVAALGAGCGGGGDDALPPPDVVAGDCATLAKFKPSVATTLQVSEVVNGTAAAPWTTPTNLFAPTGVKVPTSLCRVTGSIKPTSNSDIRFELWMPPTRAAWNGKFSGTAAGGSTGVILYSALVDPLQRGYAAMGHDNGHVSTRAIAKHATNAPISRRQRLIDSSRGRARRPSHDDLGTETLFLVANRGRPVVRRAPVVRADRPRHREGRPRPPGCQPPIADRRCGTAAGASPPPPGRRWTIGR